jgi:hypothetical protein
MNKILYFIQMIEVKYIKEGEEERYKRGIGKNYLRDTRNL